MGQRLDSGALVDSEMKITSATPIFSLTGQLSRGRGLPPDSAMVFVLDCSRSEHIHALQNHALSNMSYEQP